MKYFKLNKSHFVLTILFQNVILSPSKRDTQKTRSQNDNSSGFEKTD